MYYIMNSNLVLLLVFLLFGFFVYIWVTRVPPSVNTVKIRHECDLQYGPDYSTFDTEPNNELVKTYTLDQCISKRLCWDGEKCFNVRTI